MLLSISHITRYRYSQPMFLEPHEVRLRPREDSWQRLHEWNLDVEPAPAGRSQCAGADGTPTTMIWFDGTHAALTLTMSAVVETRLANPFDFIIHPAEGLALPMRYDESLTRALGPMLAGPGQSVCYDWQGLALPPSNPVAAMSLEVAQTAGGRTIDFLTGLTARLHRDIRRIVRPDGPPMPAFKTLAMREGSCRDTAVLFMAAAQAHGLAARFVSGYYNPAAGDQEADAHELHAWAEVYLPGAGWRGFDPTAGLACAERHVALAASPQAALAAPVTGTIRGEAQSAMTAEVTIRETR